MYIFTPNAGSGTFLSRDFELSYPEIAKSGRARFFEFCDQPWFRGAVREAYMDGLAVIHRLFRPYAAAVGPLVDLCDKLGAREILDLASGSGEHAATMIATAKKTGARLPRITLSDLFPQKKAYERLKQLTPGSIDYILLPVSAINSPRRARVRTIFTAFHHFSRDEAKALIRDSLAKGDALFIAEFNERTLSFASMITVSSPVLCLAPFVARRFSLMNLLVYLLVPIMPLVLMFDGHMSNLRVYRRPEIEELVRELGINDVTIESGRVQQGFLRMNYVSLYKRGL